MHNALIEPFKHSADDENLSEQSFLHHLEEVRFRPIFIMGDHRSGTTLLYRLLDATGAFNVVRAYHIRSFDDLLSNHVFGREEAARADMRAVLKQVGQTDRVLDGVEVTPDLPEEYGFAFGTGTYRMQLSPRTLPRAVELFRKVQFISDPDRPLLLKNPWDYFLNFMYVKQAFPDAHFIFLHRHPLDVINSQLRAVRASLETTSQYNAMIADWYRSVYRRPVQRAFLRRLFGSPFDLGARIVTRHVVRGVQYYLHNVDRIPADHHMALRYEDMCAEPAASIQTILDFLDLEQQREADFTAMVAPRIVQPLPEVMRQRERVRKRLGRYLEQYHYAV